MHIRAFVQPLPRLVYNPSDSVAVGWYRIKPFKHDADSLLRSLSAGSIVLTRLPPDAAALAAQRGYLPTHIPLLKRVGATRLHRGRSGTHRRRASRYRLARRPAGPTAAILAAVSAAAIWRIVPVERHPSGVIRQPVFWADQCIRRHRRCAAGLGGDAPMMATNFLHARVHLIVPSGVRFYCSPPCYRACSAAASTPHFALFSNVQTACSKRARPAAIAAFVGALPARAAAPPPAAAESESDRQRRKARLKGAAPRCAQKQSARGRGAARAISGIVPQSTSTPCRH